MQAQTTASGTLPMFYSGVTSFDLGTGTISLGPLSSISFQGTNAWSIELWVYLDALVDQMTLVSRAGEFQLQTQGAGLSAARTGQHAPVTADNVLTAGAWYHIAVTFDGTTMSLYVNGAFASSSIDPGTGVAPTGSPMLLGGGFYGQIDSARFWSIGVTPANIGNNQWQDYPSGTKGLVAQMDFSQNPPVDTSGNSVEATFTAGVDYLTFIPAVAFTGNGFCDPYNDEAVNPAGAAADFTVMGWICPTGIGEPMAIFTNGAQEAKAGMSLMMTSSGSLEFQVGTSPALTSSAVLQESGWYHAAATWTTAGSGALFINGTLNASATGMSLAGTQAVGAPLLGAIPSVSAQLPVESFQGFIQTLSVWSGALSASGIQTYMSQDPILATGCIADYNLATFPPQNTISLNPVGLVAGAQLTVQDTLTLENLAAARPRPLVDLEPQPNGVRLEHLSESDLSPEFRQSLTDGYSEWLRGLKLGEDVEAQMIALFRGNLDRAVEDIRRGTYRGGLPSLTERQTEISLDPCNQWIIQMIGTLALAIYAALGFMRPANTQKWTDGFTTLLGTRINSIGLGPQLVVVFNSGINSTSIYNALRLLWDYSLVFPSLKVIWSLTWGSFGIWTMLSVAARVALLLNPASATLEIAWFCAQIAYSIYSVQNVWNQRPANCPPS
ncbi:MAG TPA: LamG domain-containing protein [Thermoanaerobaculia bacterium]|nr:LamG domain-containing protein [Thermoanaerobaculia bacterium]